MPFTPGRPIAEAKADLFKAMAHPARVRILEVLAARNCSIGELATETGLELSHLSQQVSVLRRAGLVDSQRVKNSVICSLRDRRTARLLAVARQLISDNLRGDQRLLDALDNNEDAIAPAPRAAARHASPRQWRERVRGYQVDGVVKRATTTAAPVERGRLYGTGDRSLARRGVGVLAAAVGLCGSAVGRGRAICSPD